MSRRKAKITKDPVKLPAQLSAPSGNTIPPKRWREADLLKGATPEMCGPELIMGRVGKELL